jgi:hypothetical protein
MTANPAATTSSINALRTPNDVVGATFGLVRDCFTAAPCLHRSMRLGWYQPYYTTSTEPPSSNFNSYRDIAIDD